MELTIVLNNLQEYQERINDEVSDIEIKIGNQTLKLKKDILS